MAIKGLDELIRDLNNAEKKFPSECKKVMGNVAQEMRKNVLENTPKITGELRLSIHGTTPDNFTAVVYSNKHYAPHVEYNGIKRDYKGKYMFHKGLNKTEDQLPELLEGLMGRFFK